MDGGVPAEDLEARIRRLPHAPGVYRFLDAAGRPLYVGKAADVHSRVRSYLRARDGTRGGEGRLLVPLLMRRVADVEVILTETPEAALLLENTLIKSEKPPYNLRLKDDKSYLLLRVDRLHPFPRIRFVRRAKRDGALYLGPFASASGLRRTLRTLRGLYPLRTCSDRELAERTRPCLYHQIGRCAAPCVGKIDPESYRENLDQTLAILRGRDRGMSQRLRGEMEAASEALAFERAALLRDRLQALEAALSQQEAVFPAGGDRDVVAIAQAGGISMFGVVYVREGHILAARSWPQKTALGKPELLHAFLAQFYGRGKVVPPEILVPEAPEDAEGLHAYLARLRGDSVRVRVPQRGPGRRLVEMAARNAALALEEHSARTKAAQEALAEVAARLCLAGIPGRMEGYDLSHLAGAQPVAAMAVLVGGLPEPTAYRHFAVKEAPGGDDYRGLAEVLTRRLARGVGLGERPDLVLVDGGAGQLGVARRVFQEQGWSDTPVVGLAKARHRGGESTEERLVLPGGRTLVLNPAESWARLLLRLRDEAHRFAGRYQRKRREEETASDRLGAIPGVGPARRRRILSHFGSVAALRNAPPEDLAALPGIGERLARLIREHFEALA